jgi:ribose transport system substrate-binding protein
MVLRTAEGPAGYLCEMGIEVVSVTDANSNRNRGLRHRDRTALDPDISSAFDRSRSDRSAYKKAAEKGVKIVFMDKLPAGLKAGVDYVALFQR